MTRHQLSNYFVHACLLRNISSSAFIIAGQDNGTDIQLVQLLHCFLGFFLQRISDSKNTA